MPKITKTLGPIHFEDLEPHRFEDLVRDLIYDFKQWQDIQATGRGGSDDGFDIRAWEKVDQNGEVDNDDEDKEQQQPIQEGNLWMVQCKREKEIGPKRVADIIKDGVDKDSPPYGYILVAPADFSKKSFDTFREELRKKGVTEFHLWGKAALEDMLYMPKNDRLLFAFFGISLAVRQRSRKTEVRFAMNNKNKLLRVLGGGEHKQDMYESVLIRDINDSKYPYKAEYKDFDKNPHWREYIATGLHPLGLVIKAKKFLAYIDKDKKEFDFIDSLDLINRQSERDGKQNDYKKEEPIRDYWRHLPRKNQIDLEVCTLLAFEDMLVIDDKGDVTFDYPHIYCEYKHKTAPFRGRWKILVAEHEWIDIDREKYKKIKFFPKDFPESKKGKVYVDKFVEPDTDSLIVFKNGNIKTLYSVNGKYDFLEAGDKIQVKGTEKPASYGNSAEAMSGIEVMCKYEVVVKDYFDKQGTYFRESVEKQVGRKLTDTEKLLIIEFEYVSPWAFPKVETPEVQG